MKYAIGIDLGTCYSAVSHLSSAGRAEIIVNDRGESLTPSVVNFADDGEIYVGTSAQRVMFDEPDNTPSRFKRHMGTSKAWTIFETKYDSSELSTFVLKTLRDDALSELRRSDPDPSIANAIITVPAEFSKDARAETIKAAEAAGITVAGLIDEPSAALLYRQHCLQGQSDLNGNYAVVDLGGGTLDVSVVQVDGANFVVKGSVGSVTLGGIDFDRELQLLVKEKFQRKSNGAVLSDDDYNLGRSEELKKILSDKKSHRIRLRGSHNRRHFLNIQRSDFEHQVRHLINKVGKTCVLAMERCSISPADIRNVILVGGSTRVPCVKEAVDHVFETDSLRSRDCDEAVARGAGIYAASLSRRELPYNEHQRRAMVDINLVERLHKSYGIIARDQSGQKGVSFLLKIGDMIPAERTEEFYLEHRGERPERRIQWTIVESADGDKDPQSPSTRKIQEEVLRIPTRVVTRPHRPRRRRELLATFRCDRNKVLYCEFVDTLTGIKSRSTPIILDKVPVSQVD